MTLLYRDDLFLQHDTGNHPEHAGRLKAIHARLDQSGLTERCTRGTFTPLPADQLATVHDPEVVSQVEQTARQGGGYLDADTVVSAASYEVALAAAGACVAAVDAVLGGQDATALCLVRPPGHHATPTQSMGFCLFNNVALAARHALARHQLNRILVVDWDVHHGNGTQDIFYRDAQLQFLSIHRYGHGFYPGTGAADETGSGPGLGHVLNVPVAYGASRAEYHALFQRGLEEAAERIQPELILLSAGFDALRVDPVGSLGLEVEDYITMTRVLRGVAATYCQGRIVSCLEGGYHLAGLASAVEVHLRELLGQ